MKKTINILLVALLALSFGLKTKAEIILQEGTPTQSEGTFTPVDTDNSYVEATNTFSDGNIKIFLVTQDANKQTAKTVTYKGATYNLTGVYYTATESFNFSSAKVGADLIFAANTTLFFDSGKYNDTDSTNYTGFSKENFSMVGLNKADETYNNQAIKVPATTITRNPRSGTGNTAVNNTMERNTIMHKNVYIENLIFDGQGKDMYPVGRKGSAIPNSRGEFFFQIAGNNGKTTDNADGFVFRESIIQNVGANIADPLPPWFGIDYRNKNIAINAYQSTGQVNIEDLIIRNIKTTTSGDAKYGYGVISQNQASNIYYKNITIDSTMASPLSQSIKIEHAGTDIPLGSNNATFAGDINFITTATDVNHKHVYVQDYAYDYVKVPTSFKYTAWVTTNGDYSAPSFKIFKEYTDIPKADNAYYVVHDMQDDYYIIDVDKYELNGDGISKELFQIAEVMEYTKANVTTPKAPRANVKLVSSKPIPSFRVPNYFDDTNLNLVAVPKYTDQYTSTTLVPMEAGAVITLPASNNIKLYNFDFHTNAKYTLKEAISGVTLIESTSLHDPNEATSITGYPKYATYAAASTSKVTNSTEATFVNCQFTVLAKTLEITTKKTDAVIGKTYDEAASIKTGVTNTNNVLSEKVDDSSIKWYSSNPTIATITEAGKLTPIAAGTVTIFAKSQDSNNSGEVEKPFDSYLLTVSENTAPTITAHDIKVPKNSTLELLDLIDSAEDAEDGDLKSTANVVVDNNGGYDASTPGVYDVKFKVTDSLGATATVTVKVTVVAPPTIVTHPVTIYINSTFTDDQILAMVDSATDGLSKDIKSSVSINDKGGFNPGTLGTYTITYTVTDEYSQTTTKTETITVVNEPFNNPPSLVVQNKEITVGEELNLRSLIYSASDIEDTLLGVDDVTITDDGRFNKDVPGVYTVTFKLADSGGKDSIKTATVTVKEKPNNPPTITTKNKTILQGTDFDLLSLVITAEDVEDGNLIGTSNVSILSNGGFNKDVPGVYTIVFKVVDSKGVISESTCYLTVAAKTIPSTPAPTPTPTSVPVQGRTCQDDGYPAGYYWDESKQACVINATSTNDKTTYKVPPTATDNNIIGYAILIALGGLALFFVNKKRNH